MTETGRETLLPLGFFDLCSRHPDCANRAFVWAGTFDNCSRQPDPNAGNFVVPERMAEVRDKAAALLALAERMGSPVLSTTCLKVQRNNPKLSVRATVAANADAQETAFIARDASDEEVEAALMRRRIVFERLSCATGADNTRLRTFDVFGNNPHAENVVRRLGAWHWVIFGTGSEICLFATIEGFRRLKLPVTVVRDACVQAARSSAETRDRTFRQVAELGAQWRLFESLTASLR
jgi:nicotinamidase-related amidase